MPKYLKVQCFECEKNMDADEGNWYRKSETEFICLCDSCKNLYEPVETTIQKNVKLTIYQKKTLSK